MAPIQDENIPAPKHIGCYAGKCDFCGFDYNKNIELKSIKEQCCKIYTLLGDAWFGWTVCETCEDLAKKAIKYCTYDHSKLISEFPDTVSVMRKSGQLQPGWCILSDGYKKGSEDGNEVYVEVSLDQENEPRLRKTVPLSLLREWNKENS